MIIVIFEVQMARENRDRYLAEAARLRAQLATWDGFLGIERFQSVSNENRLVSISYWRDLSAVDAWREAPDHQQAQQLGRHSLFESYTIHTAEILRTRSFGPVQ